MEESPDNFLGAFKHCTLCNPVVYGGHGQSLSLTMFCIVLNGGLCALLILAVDKCLSTLNHLFIEVLIVVDWFMAVGIYGSIT